jgi:hypothetical protein
MKKIFSLITLMVLVFFGTVYPQWTYDGPWPDANYKGGTHGIVVDPDGKIWTASYYRTNWNSPDGSVIPVSPIIVFNPDGSLLDTIYTVTTGPDIDTLGGGFGTGGTSGCRGLARDHQGNILYVSNTPGRINKINYQTLQGMARHLIAPTEIGTSPTKPAVSSDGTIYIGPVVPGPGKNIATYDTDLNYLGNAISGLPSTYGIARTMEVSPDGLSIYWTNFTGVQKGIYIFTRPDELSAFAFADSALAGMSIESVAWNPATGHLWVSNDSRGSAPYSHLTWYAYDVTSKTIVDGFTLPKPDPVPLDDFPRGLYFSADGLTAYVGLFGTKYDRIFKFTKSAIADTIVDVTFQVDMSVRIATGKFNPATDVVTSPGGFNNWLNEPPANSSKVLSDSDNDSVYAITIPMVYNKSYEYKFNIGTGWDGKDETQGNRKVNVGFADMTVDPSFFNDYKPYTGVNSTVTFNVDMRLPAKGSFKPGTDTVFVTGNFTGFADWNVNPVELKDPNNDSIYTGNVTIPSGSLAIYKFIWSNGARSWESPISSPATAEDIVVGGSNAGNRIYGVHNGADTVSRYWNNENPNVVTADGNIFFEVDMSVATELGVFDANVDSVQIRGGFNGWNASQPEKSLLIQDPVLLTWYLNVPFVQGVVGANNFYKYFLKNPTGSPKPYANGGWEVYLGEPTSNGDRNRPVTYEGKPDQTVPVAYFDGIHPDWVIPTGTSVQVNFSVDMTPAMSGTMPFNPATDTVYWIPRHPMFYTVNNLTWGLDTRFLALTDPNSDMIYTGTLTLNGPSFNGFLYQYAYAHAGTLVQEDGSQGEARVRFVAQPTARTFVSPFTMPQDIWTKGEKPEESGPVTSVRDIDGGLVKSFSLEQNYPNPFNPTTTLRFTIPDAGLVSLSVFNLLGEKVADILNQEMKSGSYEVNFDASKLSSGVYLYKITTGNYAASKKMILMK